MGDDDWKLYSSRALEDVPASASGRIAARVAQRSSHAHNPSPTSAAGTSGGVRPRHHATLAVLVAILVVVGVASVLIGRPPWLITESMQGALGGLPTAGQEAAKRPLGAPAPLTRWSESFAFLRVQADGRSPVAYDPCRPIHYVVRPENAPRGGAELVQSAVARISSATGLRFVYDGVTSEAPARDRASYQPERYGDRWAPVLIAWSTPSERTDLAGAVTGIGGSAPIQTGSLPSVYTTGVIALDGPQIQSILMRPQGADQTRAIIAHELGHLVGLDHIDDRTQLMFPEAVPWMSQFGAGDLNGLAALGRGPCVDRY